MKTQLRVAVAMFIVAAVVVVGVHAGWWRFSASIGPLRLNHLLGIVGAAYVLISVPVYSYAKRHSARHREQLVAAEMFGNLLAFLLVSAHFAQQTARSPLPDLGTGLTAYALVAILVVAGVIQRFGVVASRVNSWRVVYFGAALLLYLVVGVHALRNFGVL